MTTPASPVTVVGLDAAGYPDAPPRIRALIDDAALVIGGPRLLATLPALPAGATQRREAYGSPLRERLADQLAAPVDGPIVVLASGDPLVSGVATTIAELGYAPRVEPAVSSLALARARMGWASGTHAEVSLVGRDVRRITPLLTPGRRILALSSDEATPAAVGALLREADWGGARMSVLGDLGTAQESRDDALAREWVPERTAPRLHVLAVELPDAAHTPGPTPAWAGAGGRTGLPDEAYAHDGQLTKRDLRASALARLAPSPGELLWDVGAGAGSVGIEWALSDPTCRTIAVEADPDRAARVIQNAGRFGVPNVQVVARRAPEALEPLPAPHAIFVGGGATREGVLERCREALLPGGRLVVHGVTVETEALLGRAYAELGGELTRISVETAAPIGSFTGWTPARAVTQWAWTKPVPSSTSSTEEDL